MKIIALDAATITGVAWGIAGDVPQCTTWSMKATGQPRGERGLLLMRNLADLIRTFGPDRVYVEKPLGPKIMSTIGTTPETQVILVGIVFLIEVVCASRNIPVDSTTSAQDARQHFVGRAKFKEKNGGKQASFDRAKLLRWPVTNLDEADAVALWDFGCARANPNQWARMAADRPVRGVW